MTSVEENGNCSVVPLSSDIAKNNHNKADDSNKADNIKQSEAAISGKSADVHRNVVEERSGSNHVMTGNSMSAADNEVSDILRNDAAATHAGNVGEIPETEAADVDEPGAILTEIIMSKTFTESIAPNQEFVPIGDDLSAVDDVIAKEPEARSALARPTSIRDAAAEVQARDRKPVESGGANSGAPTSVMETVSADDNSEIPDVLSSAVTCFKEVDIASSTTAPTDAVDQQQQQEEEERRDARRAVAMACREARDLGDEFRRLNELLDNLSAPRVATHSDRTSSDDDAEEDNIGDRENQQQQVRVVYRYRVHGTTAAETGRRCIRRRREEDNETTAEHIDQPRSADDKDEVSTTLMTSSLIPINVQVSINNASVIDDSKECQTMTTDPSSPT